VVRFKPIDGSSDLTGYTGFNSTVVRFKPIDPLIDKDLVCVSIPLWFDSNWQIDPPGISQIVGFNSTVVRFKQAQERRKERKSIEFQFHCGSIQTQISILSSTRELLVSIPLWFDSNFPRLCRQVRAELVSIPLWFDSN